MPCPSSASPQCCLVTHKHQGSYVVGEDTTAVPPRQQQGGLLGSSRSSGSSRAQTSCTVNQGREQMAAAAPAGALSGSTGSTISLDRKSNWYTGSTGTTLDNGVPVRSPPPAAAAAAAALAVAGGAGSAGVGALWGGSWATSCTSGAAKGEVMRLLRLPSASTHNATTCGSCVFAAAVWWRCCSCCCNVDGCCGCCSADCCCCDANCCCCDAVCCDCCCCDAVCCCCDAVCCCCDAVCCCCSDTDCSCTACWCCTDSVEASPCRPDSCTSMQRMAVYVCTTGGCCAAPGRALGQRHGRLRAGSLVERARPPRLEPPWHSCS